MKKTAGCRAVFFENRVLKFFRNTIFQVLKGFRGFLSDPDIRHRCSRFAGLA